MFSAAALWVYLIAALGAIATYLRLPRSGRPTRVAGVLLGAAALGGLLLFSVLHSGAADGTVLFCIFAAIALGGATAVITQTRAVYSALYFVVVILAVAGLLVLLAAEFLAAALVIIYAGAILVTYVFVIMLASQSGDLRYDRRAREPLPACLAGFLLMGAVGGVLGGPAEGFSRSPQAELLIARQSVSDPAAGNTELVGAVLMTRYVVVLEVAGVLLLLAMIGAIAIARKAYPPGASADERPVRVGEVGRTAAPF